MIPKWLVMTGAGALAGFVNGFLGTGGGIVLVFALGSLCEGESKGVYVTTLGITLIMSAVSVAVYAGKGHVEVTEAIKYGLGAIPGGVAGAWLLHKLDGGVVKKMFGGLLVVAGMNMIGVIG